MPFVNIKGIKVYYEVHGDGDTIVLLHHDFGSTKMLKGIYSSLVERGYRIIMYDRRGYGQSEKGTILKLSNFIATFPKENLQYFQDVDITLMKNNQRNIFDLF